uniref:Uncharacterized protein n=2 Tax=Vibrio TaxID=662 RepID=A0A0H3ZLP9_9VIBR|nr:hypothetical protein [Vibrio cyclitrophicus]AKN38203.1 hypothetical protein [Vibrio splendidus]
MNLLFFALSIALKVSQTYKVLWKRITLSKCLKSPLRVFEAV